MGVNYRQLEERPMRWEYLLLRPATRGWLPCCPLDVEPDMHRKPQSLYSAFQHLGDKRWELAFQADGGYWFKRPVQAPPA
jgi:hypothetical protein